MFRSQLGSFVGLDPESVFVQKNILESLLPHVLLLDVRGEVQKFLYDIMDDSLVHLRQRFDPFLEFVHRDSMNILEGNDDFLCVVVFRNLLCDEVLQESHVLDRKELSIDKHRIDSVRSRLHLTTNV